MKTKTNKSGKLVILSVLFAVCACFGMFFGGGAVTASAATTPYYTMPYDYTGTYSAYGMQQPMTVSNSNVTSYTWGNYTERTMSLKIYGTAYSGTATATKGQYFNFNSVNIVVDVPISTSGKQSRITSARLTNSSGTAIVNSTAASGKSLSATIYSGTLADGSYSLTYTWYASDYFPSYPNYTASSTTINVTTAFSIDATAPTVSGASTSTTYYKTSAFTVTASDATSGLENLYVKTPSSSSYSAVGSSKTVSASDTNGLYCFYAKDKAGNQSSTYYVYLDSTKPTGVIKNSSGTTLTGSYVNTAFNYTASDGGSGISYLQYKTPSSSSWTTYTSGTTIAASATGGTYQFRAVDKAGNISETKSIYLDAVKPTGVLYSGTTAVSSGTKSTASYIKYVTSDASSGIKTVYVKLPNASGYTTYTNGTQMTTNGTYSFYCVDNAGNSSATVTISLDNSAPTLTLSGGTWGDTIDDGFSVSASDNIGGTKLYYKTPSGSFVQATSTSVSFAKTSPDGTYQFYATDGYGNTSATYSITLYIATPTAQIVKASSGTQVCVIWTDSNCSGELNGESYVNGTWIKTEGEHTFVLTNEANRSTTYTFSIDHYYVKSSTVAPTCTADGYSVYECDNCGNTYNAEFVEMLGHNYIVTKEVESSCTTEGYSVYTCSRCGDTYNDNVVSVNGHDYGSWYTVKDSTCEETGTQRRDCISCGAYETESIEEKGHDYIPTVTAPTCTAQGYTTNDCSRCDASYADNYVEATGHTYIATVTDPNCTDRGYTTQTCKDCGDSYIENYVDADGHEYSAWRITKEATCLDSGLRYKTCTTCDYRYNEAIPALGHDYEAEVVEPTCVDKGYTTHICSRCGTGYNDTFVDALGHDYQLKRVEPTCTDEGYIGQCCSRCSDTYKTEILKAVGHDYVETYVEVTCTEDGCVLHICLSCGYEYKTDIVSPSGHSLETHVLLASTCTEEGERQYSCVRCEYEKVDIIPARGHNYEIVDTQNTDGNIVRRYACSHCGDYYDQEMGEQYEQVSNYVEYLFDEYSPYMMWVFLATAGVWSIAMGIAIIIANKNEDKAKAKKMLVNYCIGLIIIFGILVAAPYLVRGIAGLITG